jgi:hypothetical protein
MLLLLFALSFQNNLAEEAQWIDWWISLPKVLPIVPL